MSAFLNRLRSSIGVALVLAASATPGWAQQHFDADTDGVAVKGYDVVSYFTDGRPTPGDPQFEVVWERVKWLFASDDHRKLFSADPARFAPRYGGYCAGGMVLGVQIPIDPEAFAIVDGKLYLSADKPGITDFAATASVSVPKADANWARLEPSN